MTAARCLAAVCATVLCCGAASAEAPLTEDPEALFAAGNSAYLEGRYGDALERYADLHERFKVEDPVLYHNLGNAYFRTRAYGSAILYYQRALRLDPSAKVAESLTANIDAARRSLQTRYRAGGDASQFVYSEAGSLLYRVTHALGHRTLAWLFASLWTALLLLLIARRMRPAQRLWGRVAVPLGVVTVLVGALFLGERLTDSDHRVGVVVLQDTTLRSGKHESAVGSAIPEGLEVRIVERDAAWVRVELIDGKQGWVTADAVKQI